MKKLCYGLLTLAILVGSAVFAWRLPGFRTEARRMTLAARGDASD